MKRTLIALIAAAIAVSLALPAAVQAQSSKGDKALNKRKPLKKFDFTGDDIDGTVVKPDGEAMNVRTFATHKNLVRIRDSFKDKIMKSTEDI